MSAQGTAGGRPRDPDLAERILDATRRLLAERGYQGLSIDAVARAAGTTRPTVYLRFAGKEELATSAVAGMTVEEPLPQTDDIHADLVAELRHFRAAITRPNGFSFVGTVLAEEHATPRLIARFRERLVLPRRHRLAATLERGIRIGAIRADLDVDAATGMLTGSVYAHHLAHGALPEDWPERVVDTLWPALQAPP
jgi:AcrR family transcriptional regulator